MSRRDFLRKMGIAAGGAIGGGYATQGFWSQRKNQQVNFGEDEWGYRDILQTYADWLEKCVTAKNTADNAGKAFYILVGEFHESPESLPLNACLTNIALNLGITDKMLELDEERLEWMKNKTCCKNFESNMQMGEVVEPRGKTTLIDTKISADLKHAAILMMRFPRKVWPYKQWIEAAFKCDDVREKHMIGKILGKPSGIITIGVQHLEEVAKGLREKGAEVAVFSSATKTEIAEMVQYNEKLFESLNPSEVTPAILWKKQEMREMSNIDQIAFMPPDKKLPEAIRKDPELLMEYTKRWLDEINTIINGLDAQRDFVAIKEKLNLAAQNMIAQGMNSPAR